MIKNQRQALKSDRPLEDTGMKGWCIRGVALSTDLIALSHLKRVGKAGAFISSECDFGIHMNWTFIYQLIQYNWTSYLISWNV